MQCMYLSSGNIGSSELSPGQGVIDVGIEFAGVHRDRVRGEQRARAGLLQSSFSGRECVCNTQRTVIVVSYWRMLYKE